MPGRHSNLSWFRVAAVLFWLVVPSLAAAFQPNDLPTVDKAPPDLEALRLIIREELKAEQDKKATEESACDPCGEPTQKLKLEATRDHGFLAHTADDQFRIHIGGRVEYDNSWYSQDPKLLLGSSNTTHFNDGTLFRRARLGADGLLWGWIEFVTEVNFANIQDVSNVENQDVQVGSVGLSDFYLTFQQLPVVGNVRAGHFKAPVGLERLSSANFLSYMERSSLFDAFLGPNSRQNGIMAFDAYWDDRVTVAAAFTRTRKSNIQSFGFDAEDGKYAGSARLTALPWYADEGCQFVHVGIGGQHQTLSGHQFAVASRPLVRSGSGRNNDTPNVVFTGNFFTPQGASVVNFESAAVRGPLSLSGEYAVAIFPDAFGSFDGLTFTDPRGDVTYQAFYLEAGCFLTPGDRRRFDKKTATWDRVVPQQSIRLGKTEEGVCCCGYGALEVVARYTYLDLVSGDPVLTSTSGGAQAGTQQDVTLGVNWYLNPQVWLMVNYVWSHIDSVVLGASGDFQALGARLHVDF
jgi:phosphate-selective porin OprO/OprP